ncbi:hypothetical protein CsSME_00012712 [Camellia sinensis var. sinensis]
MATEEPKKVVIADVSTAEPSPAAEAPPHVKDVVQEKAVIPHPPPPVEEKVDEHKAIVVAHKTEDPPVKKTSSTSLDRDIALADVEKEKRLQEQLEKKKADYAEKMKNKVALLHKEAEEKRAMVQARRGEEFLKAEELAAKYRATGNVPKKVIGCIGY